MDNYTKRTKKTFTLYDAGGDLSKRWFWYWYDETGKRQRAYGNINRETTLKLRKRAAQKLRTDLERIHPPPPPTHATITSLYAAIEKWKVGVRYKSYVSYKAKLNVLSAFLKGRELDQESVEQFFDYYAQSRSQSTVHDCYRMLFLIFKKAGLQHLLEKIEVKKGQHQPLRYFQPHQAEMLKEYISENDPQLWLWCQFVYFCFIRPRSELRFLQVKHIFFTERKILIPGHISKNNKTSYIAIPDNFFPYLEHLKREKPSAYIFPSPLDENKPIGANTLGAKHREILQELGFDDEYAVYSWKHTGAVNAVKAGISLKQLQIQLRHHSLDMVDKYLRQLGVADLGDLRTKFPGI